MQRNGPFEAKTHKPKLTAQTLVSHIGFNSFLHYFLAFSKYLFRTSVFFFFFFPKMSLQIFF